MGVHVHRLGAVAPARRNGDGGAHALALELLGTGGALANASNGGIGYDTLDGRSVAVAQVLADQFGYRFGEVHRLCLKTLAHAALTTVDGGANSNLWIIAHSWLLYY